MSTLGINTAQAVLLVVLPDTDDDVAVGLPLFTLAVPQIIDPLALVNGLLVSEVEDTDAVTEALFPLTGILRTVSKRERALTVTSAVLIALALVDVALVGLISGFMLRLLSEQRVLLDLVEVSGRVTVSRVDGLALRRVLRVNIDIHILHDLHLVRIGLLAEREILRLQTNLLIALLRDRLVRVVLEGLHRCYHVLWNHRRSNERVHRDNGLWWACSRLTRLNCR